MSNAQARLALERGGLAGMLWRERGGASRHAVFKLRSCRRRLRDATTSRRHETRKNDTYKNKHEHTRKGPTAPLLPLTTHASDNLYNVHVYPVHCQCVSVKESPEIGGMISPRQESLAVLDGDIARGPGEGEVLQQEGAEGEDAVEAGAEEKSQHLSLCRPRGDARDGARGMACTAMACTQVAAVPRKRARGGAPHLGDAELRAAIGVDPERVLFAPGARAARLRRHLEGTAEATGQTPRGQRDASVSRCKREAGRPAAAGAHMHS